ncbi:MAG: hypothetical protein AAGD00_10990 [Planctomycetota bacterium]
MTRPYDDMPPDELIDLIEGELDPARVEEARAMLQADPALRRRLRAIREDRKSMSTESPDQHRAPADLVARALDESSARAARPRRAGSIGLAPWLGVAAAVGIVVVIGLTLGSPDTPEQQRIAQRGEFEGLSSPGADGFLDVTIGDDVREASRGLLPVEPIDSTPLGDSLRSWADGAATGLPSSIAAPEVLASGTVADDFDPLTLLVETGGAGRGRLARLSQESGLVVDVPVRSRDAAASKLAIVAMRGMTRGDAGVRIEPLASLLLANASASMTEETRSSETPTRATISATDVEGVYLVRVRAEESIDYETMLSDVLLELGALDDRGEKPVVRLDSSVHGSGAVLSPGDAAAVLGPASADPTQREGVMLIRLVEPTLTDQAG